MADRSSEREEADRAAILVLTLLLLANLPRVELLRRMTNALGLIGIPAPAVADLVVAVDDGLAAGGTVADNGLDIPAPDAPPNTARRAIQRGTASRRAMYLVAGARRLAAGGTVPAERRLYRAHRAAERRRQEAGRHIDRAAESDGQILGWYAKRDGRTTPLCLAAHGRNFSASSPPEIGWPGTMHAGQCRCRPGPPFPDGRMLP